MTQTENAFTATFRIPYRPPRGLIRYLTAVHAGALFCVLNTSLPLAVVMPVWLLVIGNYTVLARRFFRQRNAPDRPCLCLDGRNNWFLIRNGQKKSLRMCNGILVHRLVIVLRFRTSNESTVSFLLTRENVVPDTLRRLRVRLLHGARLR